MDSNKKANQTNPGSNAAPATGLRVPRPAALAGLGVAAGIAGTAAAQVIMVPPPVANPDTYSMLSNRVLTGVNVLSNDNYTTVNTNVFTILTLPAQHGTAAVGPLGDVTYTPLPGFKGTDTFAYVLQQFPGGASNALVTVVVEDPAQPVPALDSAALAGLSGLLAYFGMRRRKQK